MSFAFISYNHKDSAYAHMLAGEMKRRGIDVWIDDRIDYGDQWPGVIEESLETCGVFVILMTSTARKSFWVQSELTDALNRGKQILPVLLEGTVWFPLSATQVADVRSGGLPPEAFFDRVKRQLGSPSPPTVVPDAPRGRMSSIRQSLGDSITKAILGNIRAGVAGEWAIGLFQISYLVPTRNRRQPWLAQKEYSLRCDIGDLQLLLRHDPEAYREFQRDSEQAKAEDEDAWRKSFDESMASTHTKLSTPPARQKSFLPPVVEWEHSEKKVPSRESAFLTLRKRLNLFLARESDTVFSEAEVRTFVDELIGIHESHHIPLEEVEIKNIK